MRISGVLLSLLLLACGSGGGTTDPPQQQTGTVRGRVLATGDTALAGVAIRAERSGQTTRNATTDASGNFQIGSLATGGWAVTATAPAGYEADGGSLTANATVSANQTVDIATFRMRRVPQQPPTNFAAVSMVNTTFSPASVTITAGGTVRWTNNDAVQHNTTSSGNWASPNLNQNQTFERTFPTAGTFSYSCTLHAGMNGTVTVVP